MRQLPFEYAYRNLGRSRVRLFASLLGSALVVLLVLAAAVAVARVGSFAMSVEGQSIPITAGAGLLLSGMFVCAALGVIAGLVPAWRASRRQIADCFRTV